MNTIDCVVVLMLENRSFDHLFGFSPGVNGLKGTEFNLAYSSTPQSPTNAKFKVGANASNSIASGKGPGHSLRRRQAVLTLAFRAAEEQEVTLPMSGTILQTDKITRS